jgi:heme exporter protein B
MRAYWRGALAVYRKDLLLEARSKEQVSTVVVFSLLVVFIFSFAFDPSPRTLALVGPGIIWVAYTFAGILGLNSAFSHEKDKGTLEGLVLAPVGKDAVYLGKLMGTLTLMLVVELLMLPVFLFFFDLNVLSLWFLVIALLATIGFSAVGTLFSAIAVNTRSREVMLPLLFLPMALPAVIAAVAGTEDALAGRGWASLGDWVQLLLAYGFIFIVLSSLTFEFILEE